MRGMKIPNIPTFYEIIIVHHLKMGFSTSFRLWLRGILFMGDSPQGVVMPYMGENYDRKVVFEI
jgi:hypothetical protein